MAIIGIDLGTSNSQLQYCAADVPSSSQRRSVSLGGKAFPSYVAVTADGQLIVGEAAAVRLPSIRKARQPPSSAAWGSAS